MIFQIINSNSEIEKDFRDNYLLRVKQQVEKDQLGYDFLENLFVAAFSSVSVILCYSLIEAYSKSNGLLKIFYRNLIQKIKPHTIYIINSIGLSEEEMNNYINQLENFNVNKNKILVYKSLNKEYQKAFYKVFKKYSKEE